MEGVGPLLFMCLQYFTRDLEIHTYFGFVIAATSASLWSAFVSL